MGIFNSSIFNNAIFNGGDPAVPSCFFTNFEDSSIGEEPPDGWTLRGAGAHTLTVAYSSPPFKRRVATIETPDTDANTAFSVDAIDDFLDRADVDQVVAVFRPSSNAVERVAVHVRGQGSGTVTAGYQFAIDFTNSRIRIYKRVASSTTNPFSDLANTHSAGTWRLYRFRANGADLKVRAWAVTAEEPSTWGLSVTDGSPITAAGWVGVGAYAPSGTKTAMVNFFSAATGGDSAHAPILDDAFDEWLDSIAERCYLAELSATGYDDVEEEAKTVYGYISNRGYSSKACDSPPNQSYPPWIKEIPGFHREMTTALSGRADVGFGTMSVRNPANSLVSGGARDDWARMKWKRDYVKILLGDWSWFKFNFRTVLLGRLGQPVARQGELQFPIEDLLAKLEEPLQTNRFDGSAPAPNQLKPILKGYVSFAEPVPTSTSTLEQQLNDGPIFSIGAVYDDGVDLRIFGNTIASVSGNTITSAADHGMTTHYRVRFTSGTPPAPLALSTDYFVIATGLTEDDFQLSATRGGSVITLTNTTAGAAFTAYGWTEDLANGKFTPAASPAGRLVCETVLEHDTPDSLTGALIDELIFEKYGLAEDFKDSEAFTQYATDEPYVSGMVMYDEQLTALAALDRICAGTMSWYGFTPDGLLQVGKVKLPSGTPVLSLNERDIERGSLALTRVIRPVNPDTLAVRFAKRWLRSGALNISPDKYAPLNLAYDVYIPSPGSPGLPLDDFPANADAADFAPVETFYPSATLPAADLQQFYGKLLGVFTVKTRLSAIRLSIGDVIAINHSRLGWKEWDSGDPSSPDNTDTIDSTLAVVIGIDAAFGGNDAFPVRLTVFRQVPGYYPTENVN